MDEASLNRARPLGLLREANLSRRVDTPPSFRRHGMSGGVRHGPVGHEASRHRKWTLGNKSRVEAPGLRSKDALARAELVGLSHNVRTHRTHDTHGIQRLCHKTKPAPSSIEDDYRLEFPLEHKSNKAADSPQYDRMCPRYT